MGDYEYFADVEPNRLPPNCMRRTLFEAGVRFLGPEVNVDVKPFVGDFLGRVFDYIDGYEASVAALPPHIRSQLGDGEWSRTVDSTLAMRNASNAMMGDYYNRMIDADPTDSAAAERARMQANAAHDAIRYAGPILQNELSQAQAAQEHSPGIER